MLAAAEAAAGEMAAVARVVAEKAGEVGVDASEDADEDNEAEKDSVGMRGEAVGPEGKYVLYQRLADGLAQIQPMGRSRQAVIRGAGAAGNASEVEGAKAYGAMEKHFSPLASPEPTRVDITMVHGFLDSLDE